jgi:hypothetical protein
MSKKIVFALLLGFLAIPFSLQAQGQNQNEKKKAEDKKKIEDVWQKNRFWQASVGGGQYMVALERISAISRHKYVLDGAVIVDEVTVDALGQALVRFYFISPITDATSNSAGSAAARIVDRGRDIVESAAKRAGTGVHNMVVKKFPETTHARSIEYRVLSEAELGAVYGSVKTAWETGRGRRLSIKQ